MKNLPGLAWAGMAVICLTAAAAEPVPPFQVITEQTVCPEYGTVSYRRALLCDGLRMAFQPPAEWKATADAARRVLLLESPAADAQIRLRLVLPQRSETNAVAVLPPAPALKDLVASLSPGADIIGEGEYPAAGKTGKSCDFNFVQGTRRYQGRVLWVTLPECHLEVVMTTTASLTQKHPFFVEVLNSLEVQALRRLTQLSR
jgi:hypothetical protein